MRLTEAWQSQIRNRRAMRAGARDGRPNSRLGSLWRFFVAASLLVAAGTNVALAGHGSPGKRIQLVFRFDDYSPTSDAQVEVKVIEALGQHSICCTFGIIPVVRDGVGDEADGKGVVSLSAEKATILKNAIVAGTVEPALHGYDHQSTRQRQPYSEFAGLTYADQETRIREGRERLEQLLDARITCFAPPWNTYDADTVQVLEQLGFTCLTASRAGKAYQASSLAFIPATCGLHGLRDAVQSAREVSDISPIIVVLFHAYDFGEPAEGRGTLTFAQLGELLRWVADQPDLVPTSMGRIVSSGAALGPERLAANGELRDFSPLVPAFLPRVLHFPGGVYLSTESAGQYGTARLRVHMAALVFYVGVGLISALPALGLATAAKRGAPWVAAVCRYGALFLLAAGLAFALRNLRLGFRDTLAISSLLGVCLGLWTPVLTNRKGARRALAESSVSS